MIENISDITNKNLEDMIWNSYFNCSV